MNAGIQAIHKLAQLGYRAWVEGENIRLRYEGDGDPNPSQVAPLLALVKAHKDEVRRFMAVERPSPREHILTCFDCPMHEHDPINPPEGWGRCTLKNRGCYGLRAACSEIPRDARDG